MALIVQRPEGLYCPVGDFFIDPWRPVQKALITHAHADHARAGHVQYLAHVDTARLLRLRLGDVSVQAVAYGETVTIPADAPLQLSFHPAGHVLGSAQIRIAYRGEVWVVTGDYKVQPDPSCTAFEPVKAHVMLTESTFALPIYRWQSDAEVIADLLAWWQGNAAEGRLSVLFAYSLGKAQRVLSQLHQALPGPIWLDPNVVKLLPAYTEAGVLFPDFEPFTGMSFAKHPDAGRALLIAPPGVKTSAWLKRLPDFSDAFASGWMAVRGARRRRGVDRGFVMSDHADWPGLLQAIAASGAERVLVTHGYKQELVSYLLEQGLAAETMETSFEGEQASD